MLRSLFSGITGLRSHQTMMDTTGNNIANVNTTGYKSSQTIFQDTLSQLLQSAGAPQDGRGGTNPAQVGLGVQVAGITTNFGQGAAQATGRSTDLMIQGDGFFVVRSGTDQLYTRAGAFTFDANGNLVTPDGSMVQGWSADATGAVDTNAPVEDISLPLGTLLPPRATTVASFGGNLPADSTSTTPVTASLQAYDAQGAERTVRATFTKIDATSWQVDLTDGTATASEVLTFGPDGSTPTPVSVALGGLTVDLAAMTGFAGPSTTAALGQDGYAAGALQAFSLGPDGTLTGVFSNGRKQALGQIALATFNNPNGLEKAGGSMYRTSVNSGLVQLGTAGSGARGTLAGGRLEMSNVDLAQEFTNLIIAQRGFQANSRVITSSDEILQDLVNLKR